ncbi:acyl-CoA carboxylase subunit epsilon [Streptomyces sp. SAJ15]|uniref:acyl-CoA carboxylase subunit epsilon n=1 Tax=Streptomyces sp. SAJ15 TaxID=2011095 RepID=UPI0011860B75|nr:acyl-CoA carboxylase subunit epsilon [Streptomyces sp. SAJ15]TVL89224.1 hypothetical protein CD790_29065 [Streptomyces sp. SAJ15]
MTTTTAELAIEGPLGPALVKVIRGNPSPDELAAATSVLLALARRSAAVERNAHQDRRPTDAGWRRGLPDGCSPRSWMSLPRTPATP